MMPGAGDTGTDVVPAQRNLMSYRKSEGWMVMTGVQLIREQCDKASLLPWRGELRESMVQWRKCCLSPQRCGSALERCPQNTASVLGRGTVFQALGTLSWRNKPSSLWAPKHIHHETLHPWLSDIPDRRSEEAEHSRAEKSFPAAAAKQVCPRHPSPRPHRLPVNYIPKVTVSSQQFASELWSPGP